MHELPNALRTQIDPQAMTRNVMILIHGVQRQAAERRSVGKASRLERPLEPESYVPPRSPDLGAPFVPLSPAIGPHYTWTGA